MNCAHKDFSARVDVIRLEDTGRFMAEVTVHCTECKKPFQFLGVETGFNFHTPTVSIDGLKVSLPISPEGMEQSPFQKMVHGKRSTN
jgi:hypothetical protein